MHFLGYKMKCEFVNFPCCHAALLLYVFMFSYKKLKYFK